MNFVYVQVERLLERGEYRKKVMDMDEGLGLSAEEAVIKSDAEKRVTNSSHG